MIMALVGGSVIIVFLYEYRRCISIIVELHRASLKIRSDVDVSHSHAYCMNRVRLVSPA